RMSPTQNLTRAEVRVPGKAIPVIVVPGIMGSNLRAKDDIVLNGKVLKKKGEKVWRGDSELALAYEWINFFQSGRGPAMRQALLSRDNLEVDPNGSLAEGEEIQLHGTRDIHVRTGQTAESKLSLKEAKKRNWGSVLKLAYFEFLDWLQAELQGLEAEKVGDEIRPNDKLKGLVERLSKPLAMKEDADRPEGWKSMVPSHPTAEAVESLVAFDFPVHAFGYNWLASNDYVAGEDVPASSGRDLADYIQKTIDEYDDCPGVILITHSMGGLVARGATMSEESSVKNKVLGIIHTVMPVHGAGVFYKRMVSGLNGEIESGLGPYFKSSAFQILLGKDAKHILPVLANNNGPMELAPSQYYNGGKPWLIVKDVKGNEILALPKTGDPYNEIYAPDMADDGALPWWSINKDWLDPAGFLSDSWARYKDVL